MGSGFDTFDCLQIFEVDLTDPLYIYSARTDSFVIGLTASMASGSVMFRKPPLPGCSKLAFYIP
jgi:hypothetical protein